MASWVAIFVLYLFVKPDQPTVTSPEKLNVVPAVLNTATPGH
ncbi:hypothetical protein ACQPXH_08665 [Nocardia sp. CA-135953]